ncbi:peptidoglycan-binding domain-containing protein [Ktedonobacter racemifer]|uniref:Peptidoglycan-binding domain 1 protein n=1 Tax=Ktedonobacter racemifer DSM 44963 TaxID=485913 RepID=D6TV99_KTERA|nr:Peptidoglycan-binding domain 1 protein [Ktedonobacter racemifer DSM 44963]
MTKHTNPDQPASSDDITLKDSDSLLEYSQSAINIDASTLTPPPPPPPVQKRPVNEEKKIILMITLIGVALLLLASSIFLSPIDAARTALAFPALSTTSVKGANGAKPSPVPSSPPILNLAPASTPTPGNTHTVSVTPVPGTPRQPTPPRPTPTPKPVCPPLIQYGSTGSWVRTLQQELNARNMRDQNGHALAVDGDFGVNTQYAVKEWQTKEHIQVDGQVGPITWHTLGNC